MFNVRYAYSVVFYESKVIISNLTDELTRLSVFEARANFKSSAADPTMNN